MTTHDTLPVTVLQRKAIVYVRQSTQQQVQANLESQRRQYELVDVARRRGFTNVEVIDDDLGRTASGAAPRPGFDRLVAALCAGQVGAVLCLVRPAGSPAPYTESAHGTSCGLSVLASY
jgi:hypothetical protein